eukprot:5466420-Amphidinium_carterae.1
MSTDTKKRHTYARQYQDRHQLHASSSSKASKKRKTFPSGSLDKDAAEKWVPEGWKVSYDDKNGRWLLYSTKKDKTVSRSWLYHGHDTALKLALQACWTHVLPQYWPRVEGRLVTARMMASLMRLQVVQVWLQALVLE